MRLIEKIIDFIKRIINFISGHRDTIVKGTAAVGGAAAAVGIGANARANHVNKKAKAMQDEALEKYRLSNSETEANLEKLGSLQIEMVGTFDDFIETMEKIEKRPTGLKNKLAKVSLPDFKPEELATLSNNLQMAVAGAGGTVVGLGVGAAAFGINSLALGPGILVGGVVLCVKGVSLSGKASKNKREAKKLKEEVDRIVAYHSRLRDAANQLFQSMEAVKPHYISHLSALKTLVSLKTDFTQYTKDEQVLVQNTIMLVLLIHEMCKVKLVQRAEKEDSLETVNAQEVNRVIKNTNSVLPKIAPVPQSLAL